MSMYALYYLIPALLLFKYYNYLRTKNETLKMENKLLRLKSKLRLLVITGKIKEDEPAHAYLASIIDKAMTPLQRLNFWLICYLLIVDLVSNNKDVKQDAELKLALEKNIHAMELFVEFCTISIDYIAIKSIFSLTITKWLVSALSSSKQHQLEHRFKQNLMYAETGCAYAC